MPTRDPMPTRGSSGAVHRSQTAGPWYGGNLRSRTTGGWSGGNLRSRTTAPGVVRRRPEYAGCAAGRRPPRHHDPTRHDRCAVPDRRDRCAVPDRCARCAVPDRCDRCAVPDRCDRTPPGRGRSSSTRWSRSAVGFSSGSSRPPRWCAPSSGQRRPCGCHPYDRRHLPFGPWASRVPQPHQPPASATTVSRQAKRAARPHRERPSSSMSGGVLLSHAVPRAVPSALKGLTSGFGMGPGVSPSL
jgi:hypothetical protein